MKALAIVFKVLGFAWLAMFFVVWVLAMVVMFIKHGWGQVAATLSPFNIVNWGLTVLCLLPGLACFKVGEYFDKRSRRWPC